ncbi:MAG: hypothetical protein KatS3mg015_2742 [Fimbriimonadales bacterium]|nr:MAG: hypothetical protein KatS3mg015_2742 [Fimbriimonadales bacterium]
MSEKPRTCPVCQTWPLSKEEALDYDYISTLTYGYHHPQCCFAARRHKENENEQTHPGNR